MILALDLSLKRTGLAIFSSAGELLNIEQIEPDTKLSNFQKIHYTVTELKKQYYSKTTSLAIEDTFLGNNFKTVKELSRLAGAVIYSWIEHSGSIPVMYMPTSARKLVGINTKITKSETQIWVLEKYFKNENPVPFKKTIDKLRKQYVNKILTKKQLEYQINKLSKDIEEQTGLGNDSADAVIIGLAHLRATSI